MSLESTFIYLNGPCRGAALILLGVLSSCTPTRPPCASASADRPASLAPNTPLSADALFDEMLRTYHGLAHYEQKSVKMSWYLQSIGFSLDGRMTESDILFERPSHMRVRYWARDPRMPSWLALWWKDSEVHSRTNFEATPRQWESIDEAAKALTGVSGGVTTTIPMLLMGRNPWTCRGARPRLEVIGREAVGSVDCIKVRVAAPPCVSGALWIAEKSHLLHKAATSRTPTEAESRDYQQELARALPPGAPSDVRERLQGSASGMTIETVTVFEPRTDGKVDPDRFSMPDHADGSKGP